MTRDGKSGNPYFAAAVHARVKHLFDQLFPNERLHYDALSAASKVDASVRRADSLASQVAHRKLANDARSPQCDAMVVATPQTSAISAAMSPSRATAELAAPPRQLDGDREGLAFGGI